MKWKKVGVLLGGVSSERDVSLASGRTVADGLRRAGFEVVEIDVGPDADLRIREAHIEAAYIALHGRMGEDGTIQGMLEVMGIPYTGSKVTASAVAMDKAIARSLLTANGLAMADGVVLAKEARALPDGMGPPLVVKPATEGSSVGVSIVRSIVEIDEALDRAFALGPVVVVEKYVAGAEVQVAVLNGRPLGAIEIEPNREFYDYKAKYEKGGAVHHIPPRISPARNEECIELGVRAYRGLGCEGLARVDLIVPPVGSPIVLEVNTSPGMTELSLAPEIAAHAGLSFDALVTEVMNSASLSR